MVTTQNLRTMKSVTLESYHRFAAALPTNKY